MSSTVDSRILTAKFDNKQFEAGASKTLATLNLLSKGLDLLASRKGMADIQKQAAQTNLNPLASSVEGVSARFLALSTIAITALSNITNRAINAGTTFAKSFTIAPIQEGLSEYETNLKSIQVIQANTDQPLTKVNASLAELNEYSDQTIYNFSEMAKNIGTFTAAGVGLEQSASAIKGIANMAALSGSSSEQAAGAMYQLSQAIASGRVSAQDWNSVVNAGMAGKKLQTALAQTAVAMGKLDKAQLSGLKSGEALKVNSESFRESIMAKPGRESWLTSDILVNTLATLDGRFSDAALSQETLKNGTLKYASAEERANKIRENRIALEKQGVKFTDAEFKKLQQLSDSAFKSATEVKTLGQVFDIAKESIGSGWSASFQNIFGNLNQAKKLFTGMSNYINDFIKANALARNNLLSAWKKGGGRADLIDGLKAGFQALLSILKPIHEAFREIFPKKTASDLLAMTKAFKEFMEGLSLSGKNAENLKTTFKGFFAVLDIGWQVIKGFIGVIAGLFGSMAGGDKNFLDITASIGDFLVHVRDVLKEGGGLQTFFGGLSSLLSVPIDLFKALGQGVDAAFDKLSNIDLGPIGAAFGGLGDAIKGVINGDINGILALISTGLLGGIFLLLKNFFTGGGILDALLGGKAGGMVSAITDTFGTLTDTLETMQQNIKANIILKIAGAVALLAGSMAILSTIDAKDLAKGLTAMAAGFGQLLIAMGVMAKIAGIKGMFVISSLSKSLVIMAFAVGVLSVALKSLGSMSWEEIGKGMTALAGLLTLIVGFAAALGKAGKSIVFAGLAMIPLAIGIGMLAATVMLLSTLSWEEMTKGLVALAGTMAILAVALGAIGPLAPVAAAGLLIAGIALTMIAGVMKIFASMSWGEIGKSMAGLAGSLLILGIALAGIGASGIPGALALLIITPALLALGSTMLILGKMSWNEIAKGLVALGGALALLALGLTAMIVALPGAAALLVAAPALAILAGVLVTLGALKWSSIAKGLVAIAGLFVILGVAGALMGPVIPVLMGLSLVLLGMGAAMLAAGGGMLLFSMALSQLAVDGKAGGDAIVSMLEGIINLIPLFVVKVGEGILKLLTFITTAAPKIATAVAAVATKLLEEFNKLIPQIGTTFTTLIRTGLEVIRTLSPDVTKTGFKILMDFLHGIENNIGKIGNTVVRIIVKFVNEVGTEKNITKLTNAAADLLVNFMNGISKAVDTKHAAIQRAAGRMIGSLVTAMLAAPFNIGAGLIDKFVSAVTNAWNAAKSRFPDMNPFNDGGGKGGGSKETKSDAATNGGRRVVRGYVAGVMSGADDASAAGTQIVGRTLGAITTALNTTDFTPVITPVLDLTTLQSQAAGIGSAFSTPTISTASAYSQASGISNEVENYLSGLSYPIPTEPTVYLEQNNYSPKSLSSAEIYLNTQNQLSLAKEALKS